MERLSELLAQPASDQARREDGRDAGIWRLLIARRDLSWLTATVSAYVFGKGANVTRSQRYSVDSFGKTFFPRQFLAGCSEPIISIDRSFLPAFVGASPWQQAAA